MNTKNCFLLILLIFLIVLSLVPYYNQCSEYFTNNDNLNLNIRFNNNSNKPQVIVPIYSPWRMYYPYSYVYPFNLPLQNSPFYPFFDQYNIYQRYASLY